MALDRAEFARRLADSQRLLAGAAETRLRWLNQLLQCLQDCQEAVDVTRRRHPDVASVDAGELAQARELLASQLPLYLIMFGRSNTGKSTLLNQLLRQFQGPPLLQGQLLPSASQNCSARIAVVCYGPANEARVVQRRGPPDRLEWATIEQRAFQRANDIRDYMELMGDKRTKRDELMKLVEIRLPHPLLQSQLRLVDSPGMGEDEVMNQVVRQFLADLKSGVIVYVIDGKEGYKMNPDTENIEFLMEQHHSLQKFIVANRVDFDFPSWLEDKAEKFGLEVDRGDPIDEIMADIKDKIPGFDFGAKCRKHTAKRLAAVRQQVEQKHPECLAHGESGATLLGVSAKSVKDFIAPPPPESQQPAHAPYVESFLHMERHLAALVCDNGRRHLAAAAKTARTQLVRAKTLSTDFYCDQAEHSEQMTQLLERSIRTVHEIFEQIHQSLRSVLECDALDLGSPGSELNRLRAKFAREDPPPELQATDASLMMREAESRLILTLVKRFGGTREAKAAVQLLCDFKDAIVGRMRTILIWNYKMIFMVEANRPLSQLEAKCQSLMESLKQQMAKVAIGKTIGGEVIHLARAQIFSPDAEAFSELCTVQLANSMRRELDRVTQGDSFGSVVDSLTARFSRSETERDRVLGFFMESVDLRQQMADVIHRYWEQLKEQKVLVDNLLGGMLQSLREQGMRTQDEKKVAQAHIDKIAALAFYVEALATEANWTADYDTGLAQFQDECAAMDEEQSPMRLQRRLTPRSRKEDGEVRGHTVPELRLHYRLLRMQQFVARRLAANIGHVSSHLEAPVRLSWLCLADTYRAFSEDATVGLLIGFDGDYASLAELPPAEVPDASRVDWLAALLNCCAKLGGAGVHVHHPSDYRPSCVLLRALQPSEIGGDDGDAGSSGGVPGLSGDAFPDPTRLLTEPSAASAFASLAACAVVLFTHCGLGATAAAPAAANGISDPHGWDACHARELRRLANEGPKRFLAGLNRRLSPERSQELTAAVARCVRVCLDLEDDATSGAGGRSQAEQLQEARRALLEAAPQAAQPRTVQSRHT